MCSSGKNVSSSWLNLILGNGPLHPVEMLWYLQYLFMWWPLGPGTTQGEPVKQQWAGRGQELNQLQETSSSSSAYLQRLCRPFPPENVPLSSLNKELLPHLTSHRNVHWELVCLIHQSIINIKKNMKIPFDPLILFLRKLSYWYAHIHAQPFIYPWMIPDFGIQDPPSMGILSLLQLYHSYNYILILIFSRVGAAIAENKNVLQSCHKGILAFPA